MLQTCENQLYQGKHPICQTSAKTKSAANIRKPALPWRTSDMPNIRKTKKGCKHPKSSFTMANTSDMPNIRKTKKCCKHPKSSFSMANIRYVRHPKNQKVLHTCENQLYQGNTSDMSNIRKNKKCCKHPKSSFSRANIRCVNHPKNQKVVQKCENQLYQGKHPICQTSEKTKSAAIIQKPALPWQTSDMSNIRKTKKCCKHAKTSFTRANIRFVKHSKTKKCCKHPNSSFTRANIRYVKDSKTSAANIRKAALPGQPSDMSNIQKKQKVLQTSEKQLFLGKHPMCQTSEIPKSAANLRKTALPGQTSDMSNI